MVYPEEVVGVNLPYTFSDKFGLEAVVDYDEVTPSCLSIRHSILVVDTVISEVVRVATVLEHVGHAVNRLICQRVKLHYKGVGSGRTAVKPARVSYSVRTHCHVMVR